MNKITRFFEKHRLLDGYIGVLGLVFWYKILAGYSSWFYIWDFSLKWIFSTSLIYHSWRGNYPTLTLSFKLFGHGFDTGNKAAQITRDEVEKDMQEAKGFRAAEKQRIEKLEERLAELEAEIESNPD